MTVAERAGQVTRDAILNLLSNEIAKVSTAESASRLAEGQLRQCRPG